MTSAARLVELLGEWRDGGVAHNRLTAALRALILDGLLPVESQVPAERNLANAIGMSRTTVTYAYTRLRQEGYLVSRRGAGSFVDLPAGHRTASDALVPASGLDLRVAALAAPPGLAELAADAALELPRWLDHHGYDPLGLPPLREAVARRFTERGLRTRPEQVIITSGALQGLDLVARTHLRRGQSALTELPTYPAALTTLRNAGAQVRAVAISALGWDIDALIALARRQQPALAYLIPEFQNPTGALMDASARQRTAQALGQAGTLTVIDETFVDLALDGQPMPPPAACFGGPQTVTIGSLSKAVWGGLRIGWVRADPKIVQRLAVTRAATDLASPVLEQLVATRVLANLDAIVAERRIVLHARRRSLVDALTRTLPEWRFVPPAGGLFLWVELPRRSSSALAVQAREKGLHITPGSRFGTSGALERYLRLPFTLPPEQIEQAVATLATIAGTEPARVNKTHDYIA